MSFLGMSNYRVTLQLFNYLVSVYKVECCEKLKKVNTINPLLGGVGVGS
jgi:hypothetical protein